MRLKYPSQKIYLTPSDHPAHTICISHEQWCVAKFPANCSRPLLDGCLLPFAANCRDSCLRSPALQYTYTGFVSPKTSSDQKITKREHYLVSVRKWMWVGLNRWSWWKGWISESHSLTYQKARIALSASRVQKDCVLKKIKEGQLHVGLAQASMMIGYCETTIRVDSISFGSLLDMFVAICFRCAWGKFLFPSTRCMHVGACMNMCF